jgi:LuxR family transcriptional regulator, quorum-sensing system regulator BjaR1
MEVLTWTAAGKTSWEIGEILHISHRTVDFHHGSIMQKLGTHNKTQAVVIALREKLIAL